MNLERYLIEHCAPTLAGIKTANLFTLRCSQVEELQMQIENMILQLADRGITLAILKQSQNTVLIYVYRSNMLRIDFEDVKAKQILEQYGYGNLDVEGSIRRLAIRLNTFEEFPHEIGLFLGYPPEDVEGFICNKGQNCNLCGYWKVYGDSRGALIKFAKYDKCKMVYKKIWNENQDILRLTVKKHVA